MKRWLVGWKLWSALSGIIIAAVLIPVLASSTEKDMTLTSFADVIRFEAEGIASLRVCIFDLSGRELWSSGVVSSKIVDWNRTNEWGERLAYGAYLYVADGWSADGVLVLQKKGKLVLFPGGRFQHPVAPPVAPPGGEEDSPPSSGDGDAPFRPMAQIGTLSDTGIFGQVGIGTTSPVQMFDVAGKVVIDGINGRLGIGTTTPEYDLKVVGANAGLYLERTDGIHEAFILMRSNSGGGQLRGLLNGGIRFMDWQAAREWVRIDNSGNVGIGTLSPVQMLDVAGKVVIDGINGRLGIGTTTPEYDLKVVGANAGLYLERTDGIHEAFILMKGTSGGGQLRGLLDGGIRFMNWQASREWVRIDNSGNVGIGTTTPSASLEVHGSTSNLLALYDPVAPADPKFRVTKTGEVRADGSYYGAGGVYSGGADVAERINASEWVEMGNVVEIDPDHPGFFRKARSPYSTKVAGIISTSPGVVLGNSFDSATDKWADNRPMIAIAGRVPVRVVTENGPIRLGDLLVSSSQSGYAMRCGVKSTYVGAVIGKALEPLTEESGTIMVQVMLR